MSGLIILGALMWIVWRIGQLWSTPLHLVLKALSIDLPSSPRITIDALTTDSVSLHWAPPDSLVKKHIIQMDGQEVGISVRGETSVTISGLASDYLYSVQVIAVNAQGFQVGSQVVYIRTKAAQEDKSRDTVAEPTASDGAGLSTAKALESAVVQPHATPVSDIVTPASRLARRKPSVEQLKQRDVAGTPPGSRDGATVAPTANSSAIDCTNNQHAVLHNDQTGAATQRHGDLTDAERQSTIADLTLKMENLRQEIADADDQLAAMAASHAEEEGVLLQRLEEVRSKKKEDDDARAAKDHAHKQLDQQKRELEMKRNTAQRLLKQERDEYQKQANDLETFAAAIQAGEEACTTLERSQAELDDESTAALRDAERSTAIATEELAEIEAEIRYLMQRKVESEADVMRLTSESRVPSPSPQEKADLNQADSAWKEREEALVRQYDEVHKKLLSVQANPIHALPPLAHGGLVDQTRHAPLGQDMSTGTAFNAARLQQRSRRFPEESAVQSGHDIRNLALSSFNPDAAPFVAAQSGQNTYEQGIQDSHAMFPMPRSAGIVGNNTHVLPPYHEAFATGTGLGNGSAATGFPGTSSIFADDLMAGARKGSPFARHDSPISSQSGSNPSSPATHHNVVGSIFSHPSMGSALASGATGSIDQQQPSVFGSARNRMSSGSLVSSLNGVPLSPDPGHQSSSRWFWPKKKDNDPLALNRKSARSLPKSDVAPIGTRRTRSGSVTASSPGSTHEQTQEYRPSSDGPSRHAGETSYLGSGPASSRLPTTGEAAFGWDPVRGGGGKSPWSAVDTSSGSASTPTTGLFDPFAAPPPPSMHVLPPTTTTPILESARGRDRDRDNSSPEYDPNGLGMRFLGNVLATPIGGGGDGGKLARDKSINSLNSTASAATSSGFGNGNGHGSGVELSSSAGSGSTSKRKDSKRFTSFVGRVFGSGGGGSSHSVNDLSHADATGVIGSPSAIGSSPAPAGIFSAHGSVGGSGSGSGKDKDKEKVRDRKPSFGAVLRGAGSGGSSSGGGSGAGSSGSGGAGTGGAGLSPSHSGLSSSGLGLGGKKKHREKERHAAAAVEKKELHDILGYAVDRSDDD